MISESTIRLVSGEWTARCDDDGSWTILNPTGSVMGRYKDAGIMALHHAAMIGSEQERQRYMERERKTPAFTVTGKLELDLDLAEVLGNFILDHGDAKTNPALLALGHKLVGA